MENNKEFEILSSVILFLYAKYAESRRLEQEARTKKQDVETITYRFMADFVVEVAAGIPEDILIKYFSGLGKGKGSKAQRTVSEFLGRIKRQKENQKEN